MQLVVQADGTAIFGGRRLRAALGRAGVRVHKEEGDKATPAGVLPLRRLLYRADRLAVPRAAVPREPIAPDDGWCDESGHADYNRPVRLPHPARHEALWRPDPLYDLVGVLGWNDAPVLRGMGSAIFLHVATPDLAPTDGCVALLRADLLDILAAGLTAVVVQP
jgi:L,D-peptidoglycan transpeptidase YkuD (ErfK/YbiS/YcfS/YnhG family)